MENGNDVQNTTNVGNEVLADVMARFFDTPLEDEPIRTDVCKLCGRNKYPKGYTYPNGEWECKHCEEEIASMRAKQPAYTRQTYWEKVDKNGHGYNCRGEHF